MSEHIEHRNGGEIDIRSRTIDPELDWMLAESVADDYRLGGEQPHNPALPVEGALNGGVPRLEASESEAK